MPLCACLTASAAVLSSGTTSEERGYTGKPGPTSPSFSSRRLPPEVRTVFTAFAAVSPIERTTLLATNKPPASSNARPAYREIIIHIRDLDDEELLEADPSAIACFSQAGLVRPGFSLADMRSGAP